MLVMSDNLKKRMLTVMIGVPIIVLDLYVGGIVLKITLGALLAVALFEWFSMSKKAPKRPRFLSLLGFVYITAGIVSLYWLGEYGFWPIMTLLLCIWASDTCAYVTGKSFKGPKMSPTISPNKTWSGYIGALLGPVIVLAVGPQNYEFSTYALFGIVIGLVGQSGDLMVSAMKRHVKVKDTGKLFPGHGGVLDRIDALLLAAPVFLAFAEARMDLI